MPRLSKIGAAALAAFGWTSGSTVTATYLVVAGGGGGGADEGGGGGGGGYQTSTLSLNPTLSYTVTVGAGGAGGVSGVSRGTSGSDSVFSSVTSTGGGGGGSNSDTINNGLNGGSGGGASTTTSASGVSGTGGTGTVGQGSNGGTGYRTAGVSVAGGGGGGASAVGANASSGVGGNGGAGSTSSISGTSTGYAGGGGGGCRSTAGTATQGGGAGSTSGNASNGTSNLGGGGGGGRVNGGQGGSGIVIISYPGSQQFSGGVVTSSGGNTIHTFTTSGTLGPITTLNASYLVVAGGGGGGSSGNANAAGSGGGGGGGLRSGSGLTIDPNSTYIVTVGAGGNGGASNNQNGSQGSNSSFFSVSATGGGYGSWNTNGGAGGSGGGAALSATGGSGNQGGYSPVEGYAGGNAAGSPNYGGGGGGGASAVGTNGTTTTGGNGGAGAASSISGTSVTYAGGGGGGTYGGGTVGTGGSGGGGNAGASNGGSGSNGTANLGGGGGGASMPAAVTSYQGGNGGSGIVIISYPGSTQQMAGGTVTIVGGNVIHTFTSTGYLAPLKYVGNSLRFRSSASAYMNRTPSTSSGQQTFTLSAWVKRGTISAQQVIFGINSASTNIFTLAFLAGDTLRVFGRNAGSDVLNLTTTAVYRDPAAWYHIVVAIDTTQSTSSNRARMYVNGVEVTAFGTATYPAQNTSLAWNSSSYAHEIGRESTGNYLDGYLAEINAVSGSQLTPSSFGTFNSYGVWQPITYGGSYGTNGFYLPFNAKTSSYVGSFNGSNQYLATTNTQIIPATGDFTVEAMIYKTNTNATIYSQGTAGNAGRLEVTVVGTTLGVQIGSGSFSSTVAINNNQWYYIALTRTGSTATFYVNGIAAGSGTLSAAVQTTPFWIGLDWTSTYFGGYISNLRVSNVVRTISPTTAPTSSFSNDANTVFLTLQNSAIVDNSTNAYSITNNNGVSTGQTYPFAYGIFNDQGPAGNNWTPNNVSGAFGTTLDYMTDVPTLTSATAANYCVINPLDVSGSVSASEISNANLTFSCGSTLHAAGGTFAMTSGKWYWENTVTTLGTAHTIGIALVGQLTSKYYAYVYDGTKYIDNVSQGSYGASYTSGDVIGIAFDADAGTLTFYKNGTSQGTAFTGIASNTWCPFLYVRSSVDNLNYGQRPFTYTPPSGYVALNTYNL